MGISHHILGFDANGHITNYKAFSNWDQIVKSSKKSITFVDHPGHERYFKTSVLGLTSHKPHYVLLTVSLSEFDSVQKTNSELSAQQNSNKEWSAMLSLNLDGLLDGNSESESDSDSNSEAQIRDDVMFETESCNATQRAKSNDPSPMHLKYLTMCESINVPLFIVITKSDIDSEYDYKRLPKMLNKIGNVIAVKSKNKLKIKLIQTSSEASRAARQLASSVISYIPIIVTSCVNGEGLEILKTFLFSLPSQHINQESDKNKDDAVEFGIDDIFTVNKVGIVVAGIVRNGTIKTNDKLHLGPDKHGAFRSVTVKSIQVRRKDCSYAFEGQMCSLLLAEIKNKNEVRRGMVLLDDAMSESGIAQCVCYSFEASIDVLSNCKLKENSQPIIHIENIRQSAHILHIKNENVVFTFLHTPEFIRRGMKIIIRKSHGPIAIGRVSRILDSAMNPLVPLNSLQKPHRLRMSKSQTMRNYLRKWKFIQKKEQREEEEAKSEFVSTSSENDGFDEENEETVKHIKCEKILFKKKYVEMEKNEKLKCKQFKIREFVT